MRKEQNGHEGRKYLTGTEAAALMGVNPRTVYRMIERGELVAHHARSNKLRIPYDDVLAWRERQGFPDPSQADRLDQLDQEVQDLKAQIHLLQEQVDSVLVLLAATLAVRNNEEATDSEHLQPPFDPHDLARLLASVRSSSTAQRSLSVLERRGLPPGTMTVATFAQRHQVKVNRIKKLFEENHIALTIISRSNAMRNAREWWITPEQQHALILYWQQHQIPYCACPQCPHNVSDKVLAEQTSPY